MPESSLAGNVARRTGLNSTVCAAVLRGAADAIYHEWRQGLSVHFPGVGIIVPCYRKPRVVASNLPNRIRRRYAVGTRKTARLHPAPNFWHEEPYTGHESPLRPVQRPIIIA